MADTIDLADVDVRADQVPLTASVKYHGPPGCGKTSTSAARTARLILDEGYQASDVAWVTYRRSLANETLTRLADWEVISGRQLDNPNHGSTRYMSTIHAVAKRLCGLQDPVETYHKRDFCERQDIDYYSPMPWDTAPGEALFDCFQWLTNNRHDPSKPAEVESYPHLDTIDDVWPSTFTTDTIPDMWETWNWFKNQQEIIDYYEMLQAPLDMGVSPPGDIIVVDEYHDATPLMAQLCEFWMDETDIAIVAGDPDQVVNAHTGASPEFFNRLDLPRVLLDTSYRVRSNHWPHAHDMLARAPNHTPERSVTPFREGGDVFIGESPDFEWNTGEGWRTPDPGEKRSPGRFCQIATENQALADDIQTPDILFLTRTRKQVDGVGAALERAGYPFESQDRLGGWNTEQRESRKNLYNALQKIRGYDASSFEGFQRGLEAFTGGTRDPANVELSAHEAADLIDAAGIDHLDQARSDMDSTTGALRSVGDPLTLTEFAEHTEPSFWGTYGHGQGSVSSLLTRETSERDRVALTKALSRFRAVYDRLGDIPTVLTIHAAKGMEAPDVVVYDGTTSKIRRGISSDESLADNEARTWYVAMTRSSDRLAVLQGGFNWTMPFVRNLIA